MYKGHDNPVPSHFLHNLFTDKRRKRASFFIQLPKKKGERKVDEQDAATAFMDGDLAGKRVKKFIFNVFKNLTIFLVRDVHRRKKMWMMMRDEFRKEIFQQKNIMSMLRCLVSFPNPHATTTKHSDKRDANHFPVEYFLAHFKSQMAFLNGGCFILFSVPHVI